MHSLYYSLTYYIKLVIIILFYFFLGGGGGIFFFDHSKNAKQTGKHLETKSDKKENEKIELRLAN